MTHIKEKIWDEYLPESKEMVKNMEIHKMTITRKIMPVEGKQLKQHSV